MKRLHIIHEGAVIPDGLSLVLPCTVVYRKKGTLRSRLRAVYLDRWFPYVHYMSWDVVHGFRTYCQ